MQPTESKAFKRRVISVAVSLKNKKKGVKKYSIDIYCLLSLLFHSPLCVLMRATDCILCHPVEHSMSKPLKFNYKGAKKRVPMFMASRIFHLDLEALKLTQAI